jgi:hypothetical protein
VVRSLPLKRTSEALTKLVPLTVITNAPFPAMLFGGESVLIDGAALLTVKVTALELPPPGAGLKTVITGVPATATSVAVICALNWEELINVVLWSLPLKRTSELLRKPVPLTVSVNPLAPAIAVVGARLLIEGTGLTTEKASVADVPPPGAGLETAIGNVPVAPISDGRVTAVNCVGLTKVVARASPLKLTTEPLLKFVPLTVSVSAPVPTSRVDGEIVASVGRILLTIKLLAGVVGPPGFSTVTSKVPNV